MLGIRAKISTGIDNPASSTSHPDKGKTDLVQVQGCLNFVSSSRRKRQDATVTMELYNKDGVTVVEQGGIRGLCVDGKCQGRVKIPKHEPVSWAYRNMIGIIGTMSLEPEPMSALVLGAGCCIIPKYLHKFGVDTTTVDKNVIMFDLAKEYFGYDPERDNKVIRNVDSSTIGGFGKFDLVVSDLFDGHKNTAPPDKDVFASCVNKGGILISNHGDSCTFMMEPQ